MSTYTLPYPISANGFMATRIVKAKATGRMMAIPYLTADAVAYKQAVHYQLFKQGLRAPMMGRVSIHLQLYAATPKDCDLRKRKDPEFWDNTVRRLDIDNARKVLYDSLKEKLFEDDKMIFSDSAETMEPDGREACVLVTITPYVRPAKSVEEPPQATLL